MPQIQGYVLGSPTQDIREVTVTQSGTKFYLDTNDPLLTNFKFLGNNQLITDNIDQRELFNQMVDELRLIRKHLEIMTGENFSPVEVN